MSSITEKTAERGQVLVIFAGGLVAFLLVAALVFDVGQNLVDWRMQRDAADAAALAGSRYMAAPEAEASCISAPSNATCAKAVGAAAAIAAENGYVDGVDDIAVVISVPPGPGSPFFTAKGFIEVEIGSTRPSFFAQIIGILTQNVTAMAVAGNQGGAALDYSFLALNPTECPAGLVNGTTGGEEDKVWVGGTVQVNSSCDPGAMKVGGQASITAPVCAVLGDLQEAGGGVANCTEPEVVAFAPDPLSGLGAPPVQPPGKVTHDGPPKYKPNCPGFPGAGTEEDPKLCTLNQAGVIYHLSPGTYWGGISMLNNITVYMHPGIYWIGGGGFRISGGGGGGAPTVYTVSSGTTPGPGILIYNSEDQGYSNYQAECVDDATRDPVLNPTYTWAGCIKGIIINGAGGGYIYLEPMNTTAYAGLLVFQDRDAPHQEFAGLFINGSADNVDMEGTVYVPEAEVTINGTGDGLAVQVISDTWKITGDGLFDVTYETDSLFKLKGFGLVW